MNNSYLIWIPSIQNFLRFQELSWEQLRLIVKVIDESPIELIYQCNSLLKSNLLGDFDYKKLTILDRFIIFLYLKIHSCGKNINLSKVCTQCQQTTKLQININQLIDQLATKIDRSFRELIIYENFTAECDIPTIDTEYQIYLNNMVLTNSVKGVENEELNSYVMSHITKLIIGDKRISLSKFSYNERLSILNGLPAGLFTAIYSNYITNIHNLVKDIEFLSIKCDNKQCKEEFSIKFDFSNINELLKIVYKDNTIESIFADFMVLSTKAHLNTDFLSRLSPAEIDIFLNISKQIDQQNKRDEAQENGHMEQDLFQQYNAETMNLQETSSEFG